MFQKLIFNKSDFCKCLFKFLSIALLCTGTVLIFFAVTSFVLPKINFSYELLFPFTSVIFAVSSTLCGFMISRLFKENGLLYGIFCGLVISIFIIILSLIYDSFNLTTVFITKILITLISGAVGGIIGVNTN